MPIDDRMVEELDAANAAPDGGTVAADERGDAPAALRASEEFNRRILESSSDCIKVLDLDGALRFMSEGGRRLMEIDDWAAVAGCSWPSFWEGERQDAAHAALERARRGGIGRFSGEAPTAKGNLRVWDVVVTPILGADGRPERLLSVSRDVTATHAAEQAVRASERHWRGLFEGLEEGVVLGEAVRDGSGVVVDWRYVDVNSAWGTLLGLDPRDAIGRTVRTVIPAIEAGWIEDVALAVDTGRTARFTRQLGATGRWYEGRVSPSGGDRFALLFLEITERKAREARRDALLGLDERLRNTDDFGALSAAAAAAIGETLSIRRAGYGTLVGGGEVLVVERDWAAPGVASVAGRHEMRDFGSYLDDLLRGDVVVMPDVSLDPRASARADRLHALSVRAMVNLPLIERGRLVALLFANHDAPRTWADDEIAFVREVAERARDAIERRRAEHALRALANSLEREVARRTRERDRMWRLSSDLLAVVDRKGRFVAVNRAWSVALGWAEAELLGRPVLHVIHADDHEAMTDAMGRLRGGADTVSGVEMRFRVRDADPRREDGTRLISWTVNAEEGSVYAVGRDVTEQRRTEAALRQAQKMEAVGQLTGGLAHDFNNLLTGIMGSLELLGMRADQGRFDQLPRYVEAAQGAARRAAALTHRLLAFSRRQTLDPKPTDVDRLVGDMEELVSRTVGPEIATTFGASGASATALIDPNQLESALLNLCVNARDAMPHGGRLRIETRCRRIDGAEASGLGLSAGAYVLVLVTDDGVGMSPDVLDRAFDPFFTTKPIGQGTGLGLSMIYGFARQSGGAVAIRSAPGAGTTVSLFLPRHDGTAAPAPPPALSLADAPRAAGGETVLVVDDEAAVRMLVGEVLAELGYGAIEAVDGAAGLDALRSGRRIDLLVTDVGLPGGMNGRQLADAARLIRPGLVVLFITGYAETEVLRGDHLDPGMHVLTKPFALETLATRIRALIPRGSSSTD